MIDIGHLWNKICEENDEQAYCDFFDHFYPKLFNFSLQYVKIPSGAEEVVSNVIYNLLKEKKNNKHIKRINSYLFQSVRNKSINWLRDSRKFKKFDAIEQVEDYVIDESDSIQLSSQEDGILELLEETVDKLPAQRRMVFKLLREEGLYVEEVAELLGLSKRTIEKHLELAVKELCLNLKPYLQDQRHHPKVRKIFPRSFLFFSL